MSGPQVAWLPDGRRLHMNHGPIDLIVEAFGAEHDLRAAYRQAVARFGTIVEELVAELPALRLPVSGSPRLFVGLAAERMEIAAARHFPAFLTPMAAVAGAVADEILSAMMKDTTLYRAYVNDGGDIAVHLAPGTTMKVAIGGTGHGLADQVTLDATSPVRGIATSGWRGRSHSLGIADAVTVLARDAASADAAATLIANAVDLPGHAAIRREKASTLSPDSDLGDRLVTVDVGPLTQDEIARALDRGFLAAEAMRRAGLIEAAALFLAGFSFVSGAFPADAGYLHEPVKPKREANHA